MIRLITSKLFLGLLAITMLFAACGGGGESTVDSGSATGSSLVLSWEAPDATIDNTAIDPYEELDHYEIYVSEDAAFSDNDAPVGLISAVEDAVTDDGQVSRSLVTDFDLALLEGLPSANQLYVTLRAVGIDGQKSDFMDPVIWIRS
jgi:hypothetical protein